MWNHDGTRAFNHLSSLDLGGACFEASGALDVRRCPVFQLLDVSRGACLEAYGILFGYSATAKAR